MQIHKTRLEVVRGSALDQDVDAIVNAANTALRGGGGIDGAIHRAAGPGLLEELIRVAPQGATTGSAVLTAGHSMKQPYIIHTPGPVWKGGKSGEAEQLASSYRSCLVRAEEKHLKSIAFCSISTGVYGYPLDQAAPLAVQTVADYLRAHPETSLERVLFAMFQSTEYHAFRHALEAVSEAAGSEP